MSCCTVPAHIGGRPKTDADPVYVGDYSCNDNYKHAAPRRTWKETALHGERGQAVSQWIHGRSVCGVRRLHRARHEQAECLRHDAEFDR